MSNIDKAVKGSVVLMSITLSALSVKSCLELRPIQVKESVIIEPIIDDLEIDSDNRFKWETFHITAYALPCTSLKKDGTIGPSKHGVTKSGTPPIAGITAAVDPKIIPLGSTIRIAGVGDRLATDTGKWIKGHDIDLAVADCEEANAFGEHWMKVRTIRRK